MAQLLRNKQCQNVMIDLEYLKNNLEGYKQNLANRQLKVEDFKLDEVLRLHDERKSLTKEVQEIQRQRNLLTGKVEDHEKAKKLKEDLQNVQAKLRQTEARLEELWLNLPNIVSVEMPSGKGPKDDKVIKEGGKKPVFDFSPKDHVALGKALDLIDLEASAKTSGSRFYFLKNELVLMQWALFTFVLKKLVEKGFTPILPPVIVKERPLMGTGYFPQEKDQIYEVRGSFKGEGHKYLGGTAEVAMVAYHDGALFSEGDLPKHYVGYSPCFRSEAGSWGKDVKGIKRVHQFDKIEMIYFTTPETSQQYMKEALDIEEEILQETGLPYRVLEMCSGDVGFATYRKWDVEVWLPSTNDWMEVMSNSDLWDYQARRLNIRVKRKQSEYVHTVSATAITNTRPLLAILENYQQSDGSVLIPKVLQGYVGKDRIVPRVTCNPRKEKMVDRE